MAIEPGGDILSEHYDEIVPIGVIFDYGGTSAPTGFLLCDGSAVSRTTYADLFAIIGTSFGAGDGSTTFNLPDARGRVMIGVGTGTVALSFASGAVDTSSNEITVPSNSDLYTGSAVILTTSGGLPAGLSLATTYYVIRVSATVIKLATSLANAVAGTAIDITTQGTGTHIATLTLSTRAIGEHGGEERHALTEAEMPIHDHSVTDTGHTHGAYSQGGTDSSSGPYLRRDGGNDGALNSLTTNTTGVVVDNAGSSNLHNIMIPYLAATKIIKYISYA